MMNAYTIEDTIIAYFDRRLTDEESAELLHRASVSPEIRQLFEDHAALRQMAIRAAQQATIAPELEESLFARIAELQEEEKLPVGFWNIRRLSLTAGAVALVLAVVTNFVNFGNSNPANLSRIASPSAEPISMQFNLANASFGASNIGAVSRTPKDVTHHPMLGNDWSSTQTPGATKISEPAMQSEAASITMEPAPRSAQVADIPITLESPGTLESLEILDADVATSKYEFALAAPISGFVGPAPASGVSLPTFPQWSASAAYNFDDRNQVGVKATFGQFVGLSTTTSAQAGFRMADATMQKTNGNMEELLYQHREPIAGGLFFVTAGIGGGFYNNSFGSFGNVLSAELGLQIPFGDKMLGGVSFVADRLHQSGSGSVQSIL